MFQFYFTARGFLSVWGRLVSVSEQAVQQAIRLAAPRNDCILWRNNNGACKTDTDRQIRYGLGNDSHQINDEIKSSDLIGITRTLITPAHVGQVVGVFTSIEVKRGGWHYTGTAREVAQNKWLHMVQSHGGVAGFAQAPGDVWPVVTHDQIRNITGVVL